MVVNAKAAWKASFFLATFYVTLGGDVAADVLTIPYVLIKKGQNCVKLQTIVSAVCVFMVMLYGTINMQVVRPNYMTVSSEKLKNSYKIVFLSDLHVGSSQSMATIKKTIKKVDAENPDFVLLGGDITDEYTKKDEMKQVYDLIGTIDAPVYYIYGNHDRQPNYAMAGTRTYSDDDLKSAFKKNNIKVLEDEWVQVADDLVIMGRDDVSTGIDRIDLSKITKRPNNKFVILLNHSPYSVDDTIATEADFQLSGHTHAGQLFPLRMIYDRTNHDAYGFYVHGYTTVYVSAGVSGWSFPLRTEAVCQYDVITFKKVNSDSITNE